MCNPLCVCAHNFVHVCFAMFCIKMFLVYVCIVLIGIIMGVCTLDVFSLSCKVFCDSKSAL